MFHLVDYFLAAQVCLTKGAQPCLSLPVREKVLPPFNWNCLATRASDDHTRSLKEKRRPPYVFAKLSARSRGQVYEIQGNRRKPRQTFLRKKTTITEVKPRFHYFGNQCKTSLCSYDWHDRRLSKGMMLINNKGGSLVHTFSW